MKLKGGSHVMARETDRAPSEIYEGFFKKNEKVTAARADTRMSEVDYAKISDEARESNRAQALAILELSRLQEHPQGASAISPTTTGNTPHTTNATGTLPPITTTPYESNSR